jgi:hypothetical protein
VEKPITALKPEVAKPTVHQTRGFKLAVAAGNNQRHEEKVAKLRASASQDTAARDKPAQVGDAGLNQGH